FALLASGGQAVPERWLPGQVAPRKVRRLRQDFVTQGINGFVGRRLTKEQGGEHDGSAHAGSCPSDGAVRGSKWETVEQWPRDLLVAAKQFEHLNAELLGGSRITNGSHAAVHDH